jgi:hypothetical protein
MWMWLKIRDQQSTTSCRISARNKLHRKLGKVSTAVRTRHSLPARITFEPSTCSTSLTACDRAFLNTPFIPMPGSESHHDQRRMRSSSPTQSGLWETAQRFYSKSYAGDYIGLVILLLTLSFFETSSEPFHQMFTIDDPRIQHPHAEIERVPVRTSLPPTSHSLQSILEETYTISQQCSFSTPSAFPLSSSFSLL